VSATDEQERLLLDLIFGGGASAVGPAIWYPGLSLLLPNDDGSQFLEPVGGSYGRPAITNNLTNFPAALTVGGVSSKRNGSKWTWPNPTSNWGLAVAYGLFTGPSGGVPRFVFRMDEPRDIRSGNTPVEFDANTILLAGD
jgi:hypothetical protein